MGTKKTSGKRPLWEWILLLVLGFIISTIGYAMLMAVNQISENHNLPIMNPLGAAVYLVMYAVFVKLIEKHWPTDLSLRQLVPHLSLGLLVGFVFMVLVVCTITALGNAFESWSGFSWKEQFAALMLFLSVAVAEEVIERGVIFRLVDERWGVWVALLVSALTFGFGHIFNDNATWWSSLAISIEAGLLLGAAYKWSGSLWLPIGIHWAWNYVQGNVFGLAVSGMNAGDTMLVTTVDGPDIVTGGAFGPEASIVTVILGTLLTIVFLWNRYRPNNKTR